MNPLEFQEYSIRVLVSHKLIGHIATERKHKDFEGSNFIAEVIFTNSDILYRGRKIPAFVGTLAYEVTSGAVRYSIDMSVLGRDNLGFIDSGILPIKGDLKSTGKMVADVLYRGLNLIASELDKSKVQYNSTNFINGIGDGLVYLDTQTPDTYGGYSIYKNGNVVIDTEMLGGVKFHLGKSRAEFVVETTSKDFRMSYNYASIAHKILNFRTLIALFEQMQDGNKKDVIAYKTGVRIS